MVTTILIPTNPKHPHPDVVKAYAHRLFAMLAVFKPRASSRIACAYMGCTVESYADSLLTIAEREYTAVMEG